LRGDGNCAFYLVARNPEPILGTFSNSAFTLKPQDVFHPVFLGRKPGTQKEEKESVKSNDSTHVRHMTLSKTALG